MYNRVTLPKDPKWARHILRWSKLVNMGPTNQLEELAKIRSFTESDLPSTLKLSQAEQNALQYMLDWNGRCLMLSPQELSLTRHVVLMGIKLLGSKRVLITSKRDQRLEDWHSIIKQLFPDAAIHFEGKPDLKQGNPEQADLFFYLIRNNSIARSKCVQQNKFDHYVSDDDDFSVNYDFSEHHDGLASEFMRTTLVGSVPQFWINPSDTRSDIILGNIFMRLQQTLKVSPNISKYLHSYANMEITSYLKVRGGKYNLVSLMESIGVCTSTTIGEESQHYLMLSSSDMLVTEIGDHSKRRSEVVLRYKRKEEAVIEALGSSMAEVVTLAMQGSSEHIDALEQLKTTEWAKIKTQMFHKHLMASRGTNPKTIILANNTALRRSLIISSLAIEFDRTKPEREQQEVLSNFAFPSPSYREFELIPDTFKNRSCPTIIMRDITELDVRILTAVDRMIIAEYGYSRADIDDLITLSKIYGFRLIFGTMRGTFEDELSDNLLKPL